MNFNDNFYACYKRWQLEFFNFIVQTQLELDKYSIQYINPEMLIFNKFIYYLWGSSLDQSIALTLDHKLAVEPNFAHELKPYASTKFNEGESVSKLIHTRNSQYLDCLKFKPENINLNNFKYDNLFDIAYNNVVIEISSLLDPIEFVKCYNYIFSYHHTFFLQGVESFFNESKGIEKEK